MRDSLGPLLGKGLLLTDGELHRKQRKVVSPAFHFHNLKAMMPGMVDCTAVAMAEWIRKVKGETDDGALGTVRMTRVVTWRCSRSWW